VRGELWFKRFGVGGAEIAGTGIVGQRQGRRHPGHSLSERLESIKRKTKWEVEKHTSVTLQTRNRVFNANVECQLSVVTAWGRGVVYGRC
jgi:hypothetical protein